MMDKQLDKTRETQSPHDSTVSTSQDQPLPVTDVKHSSEMDRREGKMDHGETGGNFDKEQDNQQR